MASRPTWPIALAAALSLCFTYWLYHYGLSAAWMYDDAPSLQPLKGIADLSSALDYLQGGITGPLGRPLALASFLLNASDWPDQPASFRFLNLGLHLFNGALAGMWVGLLARATGQPRAAAIALTGMTLWLVHPLLSSSVLSVVQRMTLLAALFQLLGLIGYTYGRLIVSRKPVSGLLLMSVSLLAGTVCAVLSKENGALLPLFAAVVETSLLSRQANALPYRVWLAWRWLFFGLPAIALLAYTTVNWQGYLQTYASRSFGLDERVATQLIILWDYLRQLLIPDIRVLGLFHDDVAARNINDSMVWLAGTGWLLLLFASALLYRRIPWLVFAVTGYLVGHLIESTVIPLELYFEHRNYFPSLFVITAASVGIWKAPPRLAAFITLTLLLAYSSALYSVTTLWGEPRLAGAIWYSSHPESARAAQFQAQQLMMEDYREEARLVITETADRLPKASDLMLQVFLFDCQNHTAASKEPMQAAQMLQRLPRSDFSLAAIDTLVKLEAEIDSGRCHASADLPVEVARTLLGNPKFNARSTARDHLHNFLARKALAAGNPIEAEQEQRLAYDAAPTAENAQVIAVYLLQQGRIDEAIDFLRTEKEKAAMDRARYFGDNRSQRKLGKLLEAIEAGRATKGHL